MTKAGDRVMTHEFGPATLIRLYKHKETRETVWEVATHDGYHMHLSQRYVDKLPLIVEQEPILEVG